MVLEDVTEMYVVPRPHRSNFLVGTDTTISDPAEGNVKLPKILLNGNNICMVLLMFRISTDVADRMTDGAGRRWTDGS